MLDHFIRFYVLPRKLFSTRNVNLLALQPPQFGLMLVVELGDSDSSYLTQQHIDNL